MASCAERTGTESLAKLSLFCKKLFLPPTPDHGKVPVLPLQTSCELKNKFKSMNDTELTLYRAAANKETLMEYEDQIIAAIRKALVDPEASVRAAAAQTFDTAQHYMGAKAVDQTIPTLLEAMRNPGEASETALQALKEVMSVSLKHLEGSQRRMMTD